MKIQAIIFTGEGAQVTYIEERDVHTATGVIQTRTMDIPHGLIPQDMYDDLTDSVQQIVDHVLTLMREPADQFRAGR